MTELTEDDVEREVVTRLRLIQAAMLLQGGDVEIEKLRKWTVEQLLNTCLRNRMVVGIWPTRLEDIDQGPD